MDPVNNISFDDTLKTIKSYRKIPFTLNDRIKKILLDHKKEQQEIFKTARAIKQRNWKWSEDQYIFLGRNYYPYNTGSLANALREFRTKYNLEYVSPYGLRHSFATYWSERKMDDAVLQELMRTYRLQNNKKILYKNRRKVYFRRN